MRAESDLFSNIIININTLELVTFLLNLEEIFHDSEIFFLFILDRYVENVEWGNSFKRLVFILFKILYSHSLSPKNIDF